VNSPPPKPEVILTNFFAEPTVLLVPITSRDTMIVHLKTNNLSLCLNHEHLKAEQLVLQRNL
jgi:hypothetical protein